MQQSSVSSSFIVRDVENLLKIHNFRAQLSHRYFYHVTKRLFDIVLSSLLIIVLSPLLMFVSILVLFSPGQGIIFSQLRYSKNKTKFQFHKFRSMNQNISTLSESFVNENGYLIKAKSDPRITSIGKFIRKTSMDELPQLFNILKGDMSFVGPRPLIEEMVAGYGTINSLRTIVKPGLTGLWQISARHNNHSVFDMLSFDIEYIEKCSIWFDIMIILKTIPAVLTCKGAV